MINKENSMRKRKPSILIDTSFPLPTLGIGVLLGDCRPNLTEEG
jgi:hypothetical protein